MQSAQQEMTMSTMFNMNRPTNTEEFLNTCKELRAYMADYTNTSNVPSGTKGGWYAVVTKKTGKVWLAHSKNLQSMLTRFRTNSVMPNELKGLVPEGLALFLTTKDIDIDQLRFALEETNSLLHRGTRTNSGAGKLYVVTHSSGHYYLTKARTENGEHNILTRFINRVLDLKQSFGHQTNYKLQQFVSDHAGDLLRETGFEVREVASFKDSDEAVELMNQYYIDQTNLVCLNHVFDKR